MGYRRPSLIGAAAGGAIALSIATSAAARAQDCPPGEWFCEDAPDAAPPEDDEGSEEPLPEPPAQEDDAELEPLEPEQPRPHIVLRDPDEIDRRERNIPWFVARSAWSANLRLEGALIDARRGANDGGMGGIGGSLRYRATPVVTFDLGLDAFGGTDYNGYDRAELAVSLSTLLYFNPAALVRAYGIVGLSTSAAWVDVAAEDQTWGYFGGHGGLGVEVPLGRRVALTLELLGFFRGRTDQRAEREPEFEDSSGRVTNTSGGGLFRAGVSLYW
jgi:hypothetical protein